jgi:hypothetical protein
MSFCCFSLRDCFFSINTENIISCIVRLFVCVCVSISLEPLTCLHRRTFQRNNKE